MTYTISDFYCVKCGHKGIPIPRKPGSQRGPGHLKKLYCIHCKKEVNHVEVKPKSTYRYDDFRTEFEGGNFNEEGNRLIPWKQFLQNKNN